MSRWIDLDGVVNMRDVGGLPTQDGGVIQRGRLIRSDHMHDLSPSDVRFLVDEVGVSDVVDLRSDREIHLAGPAPLRATPLRHHHHSLFPHSNAADAAPPPRAGLAREAPRADTDFWGRHYRGYLATRPDSIEAALEVVATAEGATIVHCAAGKDRTGTVVALALAVAGVSRDDIVADYVLTGERLDAIMKRLMAVEPYITSLAGQSRSAHLPLAEAMTGLLDMVEGEFGGAAGWLHAQGWSDAQVQTLRTKLTAQ